MDRDTPSKSKASDRHHIVGIEISRGLAAILVILFHVSHHIDMAYGTPLLRSALQYGHAGVDLFFVISGFIILYVHYDDVGNPNQFARYARRRLTRIFPTYWVALALTILMAVFYHGLPSPAELFRSAFLLPSDKPIILGIAWTLRYEMLFYVMFCALILNRRVGIALLACWFIGAAFCTASGIRINSLPQQFQSAWVLEFLFGMVVAYIAKEKTIRRPYMVLAVGLSLFACAGVLEVLHLLDGYGNLARLAYGVPSALIILGLATLPRGSANAVPGILRSLGTASYSLYIFQFVFIGTAWQFLLKSGAARISSPFEQFLFLSSAAIIGGVITAKVVEQPLIRLCRVWTSPTVTKQFSLQK